MYWLALYNIITIVVASGLFIDSHFVRKDEAADPFIGGLLIMSIVGGLVISMLTFVNGR